MALLLMTLVLTTGCMLGPDYKRPDTNPPQTFVETAPAGESIANMAWWELFKDPVLQDLIRTALRENRDLKSALARINEARAALGYTKADQWPSFGYGGSASHAELSTPNFLYPLAPRHLEPYVDVTTEDVIVAADVSFQIDLWGRLRRSTESARAQLMASEEAYRTVTITLVSDVATVYLLLRQLDAQLEVATGTLASRRDSLRLIQARYEAGLVPLLDVNQAEMLEAGAASTVASLQRGIGQTEHALSFLLGRNPSAIPRGLGLDEQVFPPEVPAGLPSELLERRPDIRTAEEALHAQTALIGVTIALMLPNFALTGSYGHESLELTGYPTGTGTFWTAGLGMFGPLFQFGKNKSRVEVQRAKTEEALQTYEKAALNAFREVEDALVAVRTYKDEYDAVQRDVAAARSASRLSHARYDEGYSSFLEVLETDRILFTAELQAAEVLQQRYAAVISLYKALGGGWSPENPTGAAEVKK
jgi:outer membrane protein, multidrug efflux system